MIYSYCLVVIVTGGRAGAPAMHVYNTLGLKGEKKGGYTLKKYFGLPEAFIQL